MLKALWDWLSSSSAPFMPGTLSKTHILNITFFSLNELLLLSVSAFKMHKDNLKYISTSAAIVNGVFYAESLYVLI